jgi:PKHD-type hydroxylase|tara:strand:- start:50 stop:670 length:621 start_codon:yes stop_codon:yes gene_type:complete
MISWKDTKLPLEMVNILEKDIKQFDESQKLSDVSQFKIENFNNKIRNSKHTFVSSDYWFGGWLWYYIQKINKVYFLYDLYDLDNSTIQYTRYDVGDFYDWHKDADVDTCFKPNIVPSSGVNLANDQVLIKGECVRKLSFSLQLSDENDYTGGELVFRNSDYTDTLTAPKDRGTLIIFDSRLEHKVCPVKTGIRKSIVGWIVGPRWR